MYLWMQSVIIDKVIVEVLKKYFFNSAQLFKIANSNKKQHNKHKTKKLYQKNKSERRKFKTNMLYKNKKKNIIKDIIKSKLIQTKIPQKPRQKS